MILSAAPFSSRRLLTIVSFSHKNQVRHEATVPIIVLVVYLLRLDEAIETPYMLVLTLVSSPSSTLSQIWQGFSQDTNRVKHERSPVP